MSETYFVELSVESDSVDWHLFGVDRENRWESLAAGSAYVYGDALLEAQQALKPFIPEVLR